jgi:hypothetical protein
MAAKKGSRKAGGQRKAAKVHDLTDRSGRGAKGSAKEYANATSIRSIGRTP